jgi:hypothetical protein
MQIIPSPLDNQADSIHIFYRAQSLASFFVDGYSLFHAVRADEQPGMDGTAGCQNHATQSRRSVASQFGARRSARAGALEHNSITK